MALQICSAVTDRLSEFECRMLQSEPALKANIFDPTPPRIAVVKTKVSLPQRDSTGGDSVIIESFR